MERLDRILAQHGVFIVDGALATELEAAGCDLDDELWSAKVLLEAPERIRDVHVAHFLAGADCATTATYQASFPGLARRGLDDERIAETMRLAVRLACEARDEALASIGPGARTDALVVASIGSYGAFLHDGSEFRGRFGVGVEELKRFHRPRLRVLSEEKDVDLIAFETIPSWVEAQALVELLEEVPARRAWMSFSARDPERICDGETIRRCAERLAGHPQLCALGVNCTPPQLVTGLIEQVRSASTMPVVVYPNAETYSSERGDWAGDGLPPERLADLAESWFRAGARLIGGCCRTRPAHIAAVSARLRALTLEGRPDG